MKSYQWISHAVLLLADIMSIKRQTGITNLTWIWKALWSGKQSGFSIQENAKREGTSFGEAAPFEHYASGDHYVSSVSAPIVGSSSSPSGGLACAIAALAERQQLNGGEAGVSTYSMHPGCSQFAEQVDLDSDNYSPPGDGCSEVSLGGPMLVSGEWNMDLGSVVAEAGTSYASPDSTQVMNVTSTLTQLNEVDDSGQSLSTLIIPETYEEQMMLEMAVSLAEARAMTSGPGVVAWQ